MLRYQRRHWALATALASIAGFVDAIGFLKLGGFFVSFMSGNSTQAGVAFARFATPSFTALALIGLFVAGVIAGSLIAQASPISRQTTGIGTVAVLLTLAAALQSFGLDVAAIAAMTLAMGGANVVFERDGEVSIGVTYMTGTLVKAGQRIAEALMGGRRLAWLPYILLWSGLVLGAGLGTLAYQAIAMRALWLAAIAATALAGASFAFNEPSRH